MNENVKNKKKQNKTKMNLLLDAICLFLIFIFAHSKLISLDIFPYSILYNLNFLQIQIALFILTSAFFKPDTFEYMSSIFIVNNSIRYTKKKLEYLFNNY
jgi:hypothetical protein